MSALVEVRELSKAYGPVRAVDGVSFDVEPGQAVCLLGPNGSGKSTLIRLISTLLLPDDGSIVVGFVEDAIDRAIVMADLNEDLVKRTAAEHGARLLHDLLEALVKDHLAVAATFTLNLQKLAFRFF